MTIPAAFKGATALAIHTDLYAGERIVALVPFTTKRKSITVRRWRWMTAQGESVGHFANSFGLPQRGMMAVMTHREFRDVRPVEQEG